MKKFISCLVALAMGVISAGSLQAEENAPEETFNACRSVHLIYPAPEAVAFYNEMTIEESQPCTYFMVCGFNGGYYGLQELQNGAKVLLFSIWDSSSENDPNAVKEEDRVKLLYKDPDVRVGRFGYEGTGGQSFLDMDWQVGETYRFCVTCKRNGNRTEYTNWFFMPEEKYWRKLVTFSTITKHEYLGGYYSFVEDFLRNGKSYFTKRRASYGNGWVMDKSGQWHSLNRARFSADGSKATNINCGAVNGKFYLQTGGDTRNTDVKLWDYFNLTPASIPSIPSFQQREEKKEGAEK